MFGTFQEFLYDDGQRESIALVMGRVEAGQEVLCRVHRQHQPALYKDGVAR